ncbi:hypothetical protein ACEQ8H_006781 [Pleosporales sp. CAS-2024a]
MFDSAHLALWIKHRGPYNRVAIPSAAVSLVGSIVLLVLSAIEHMRTVRPSWLLNVYLLLTVVFDIARSRTYSLSPDLDAVATVFTSRVAVELLLAFMEARSKRRLLLSQFVVCTPEAVSGPYKRALFWWLNALFKKGYFESLDVDNLFQLDKHLQSDYLHHLLGSSLDRLERKSSHSLFIATLRKLKWPVLSVVPPRLCLIGFNFCQPFLINRAVKFSQQPVTPQTTNIGYGLIGAYFLVFLGMAVSTGQYQHKTFRFITMMRGGLISMLYSKATGVALTDVDTAASLTLMSADIERIVTGMETAHEAIERRIAATGAMLDSMKGVKMCGLTDILRDDLQRSRIHELETSKKFRKLLIWTMMISYISPIVSPILAFTVFALLGAKRNGSGNLSTATVFTSLSLFTLLAEPLSSLIFALSSLMGGVGSFQRIQEFVSVEARIERRTFPTCQGGANSSISIHTSSEKNSELSQKDSLSLGVFELNPPISSPAIIIEHGLFGWDRNKPSGVLQDINMIVPRGKITMVVGPVGCGKSTLLKAVLGELPVMAGTLQLSSLRIALCDQTAWHVNGTVQQSITGSSAYDLRWYSSVVRSCALDEDLRQLPQGDQTQIGSKGVALSGGQSQRIALARAIYAQKDIVILDDCFSGLDGQTENRIWHSLFGHDGLLKRCRTTVLIASSSTKRLPYCDHIISLSKEGHIDEQGSFDKLNLAGGYVSGFDLAIPDLELSENKNEYEAPPRYTEQHVASQVTEEQLQAKANRRIGDLAIYRYYVGSVGWIPSLIFVVSCSIFIFGISFPSIWVKMWAEYNDEHPNKRLGFYLGIYSMLGAIAFAFLGVSCWQLIITMVPRSGIIFHQKLLDTVLGSPMSFFSTVDTGVTLNRFSQDLMLIDMELPLTALNTFATFMLCIAQMVLIAVAAPFAAISFPIVVISVYFIQKFYLRTSRQLRFLDLEAKSPLYTQFNEILEGLATIRAFGWQGYVEEKARGLLDRSQRPFYLLFAVQRWLSLVLDLVVTAIATILIVLVVALRGKLSAGYVGVALLNVVLFSQSIKLLITFWTQLETHIGSVARIKTFTKDPITEDKETEDHIPPATWPSQGRIDFNDITVFHRPNEPVIQGFSLSVKPGEKVAIVGRTGSGKSSLVLSLFRMAELSHGTITIDKLPIHRLPRQNIRSRLIGLPQDAYLLPGSVRLNADPRKQSTDKAIIQALKDVTLWDEVIVAKGDADKYNHPLDVLVEELHLSHGQRQLFCMARALLRRSTSNVLVLDEPTSNLDAASDAIVQRLLRQRFAGHTIMAVAHRLDTILDFDKVVVMNQGSLVEYGEPYRLLEQQGSWFKSLYEEADKKAGEGEGYMA